MRAAINNQFIASSYYAVIYYQTLEEVIGPRQEKLAVEKLSKKLQKNSSFNFLASKSAKIRDVLKVLKLKTHSLP